MDLNDALHSCRCGAYIRDDANMAKDWKIHFIPDAEPRNLALPRSQQVGAFFYINPKTGPAHQVFFRDAMKASSQWRTTP